MHDSETKTAAQAEMFANRLKKRHRHLHKWAQRTGTGAFRLYDRDIPEIPLVLDKYDDVISGALYQRPYEKDEAEEDQWLQAMGDAAAQALGLRRDNIIIKRRQRQRRTFSSRTESSRTGGSRRTQYGKIADRGLVREIREGNFIFKVNLSDYLDTGLFLDRRVMRRMVNADSGGKRVLNLFCYTASFSVHAAGGGAVSTDSVDLSNTYLNRARENFTLNGFDTAILRPQEWRAGTDAAHRLIRADVVTFLRTASAARQRWDSIIIDPPAFSNSAMASADFDLNRNYEDLLADCLGLLAPGGKIWFSANARSFKVSAAELEIALAERFAGIKVSDQTDQFTDEDFKDKKVPKAFIIGIVD
ncbi:MAG: class I SAM-dependent methyltransferase [Treponema sp.]|jgi:23S rRNA G2069 N7-methylase RlmK/C1962 C5-methylase RlmI|nr:class I SAM-dependent methyltransferase [Treponema sp.]